MEKCEYSVNIETADNGIIVQVGCKRIVVLEDGIGEALNDVKLLLTGGYKAHRAMRVKYLKENLEEPQKTCSAGGGTIARDVPPPLNSY